MEGFPGMGQRDCKLLRRSVAWLLSSSAPACMSSWRIRTPRPALAAICHRLIQWCVCLSRGMTVSGSAGTYLGPRPPWFHSAAAFMTHVNWGGGGRRFITIIHPHLVLLCHAQATTLQGLGDHHGRGQIQQHGSGLVIQRGPVRIRQGD